MIIFPEATMPNLAAELRTQFFDEYYIISMAVYPTGRCVAAETRLDLFLAKGKSKAILRGISSKK